jgi:hypothetical protein
MDVQTVKLFFDDPRSFLQGLSMYNARLQKSTSNTLTVEIEKNGFDYERAVTEHLLTLNYVIAKLQRKIDEILLFRKCPCYLCKDKSACAIDETNFNCRSCCKLGRLCFPVQFVCVKTIPIDEMAKLTQGLSSLSVNQDSIGMLMDGLASFNL